MVQESSGGRPAPEASGLTAGHVRLEVLDGWRALSILLVLGCHMLPLGPKSLYLNYAAALAGMALFFTLSGFLIVSTLRRNPSVPAFLIRRLCRIVPLAYLATFIYLGLAAAPISCYPPYLLFYVNYDNLRLVTGAAHFWSICVEMQFYGLVAILVAILGRRGLLLVPVLGLTFTAIKIWAKDDGSMLTHLRVDEIMAGGCLALIWSDDLGRVGRSLKWALAAIPLPLLALLFLASCHHWGGPFQNLRPYMAASLVGGSLSRSDALARVLTSRALRYIAEISFALYIVHELSLLGWLDSGERWSVYLFKRPLSLLITFGLAHLSTFYFERPFMALGKRWTRRWDRHRSHPHAIGSGPVAVEAG